MNEAMFISTRAEKLLPSVHPEYEVTGRILLLLLLLLTPMWSCGGRDNYQTQRACYSLTWCFYWFLQGREESSEQIKNVEFFLLNTLINHLFGLTD